jgi:FMN phosphatase YigB (HAD superfamily)
LRKKSWMSASVVEKYLVLDMDGTLYLKRNENVVSAVMAKRLYEYAAKFGIPEKDVSRIIRKHIRELKINFLVNLLSEKYGLDAMSFANYAYDVEPRSLGIRRDRKLESLLLRLSRTRRIILFTNSPMVWVNRVIRTLGLAKIIGRRSIVCYETLDCGRSAKPCRDAYRILLKRTGNDPRNLLFLEDTYKNVAMARKQGIRSIRIHNKPDRDGPREKDIYAVLGGLLSER